MSLLYILVAVLLLAILIVVHEMGHFWAARAMGIPVSEFSVGFGPKLIGWKSRKYETQFSVRLIPLGGYCAFYGEDSVEKIEKDDPRLFPNQNVWKRLFTILMGPMMNFVLAFVLATGYYWVNGIGTVTGVDPYISEVTAAGPAYEAGLEAGDVIESINGENMLDGTTETLLNAIGSYQEGDEPLRLVVRRGEETEELSLTPRWDEEEGRMMIGVMIAGRYRVEYTRATLWDAMKASAELCWNASGLILNALKNLVTTGEGLDQTSGPVGIISTVSTQVAAGGFQAFLEMLISISINLGLMNLLPIPGLDGSRLVFGLIEVARGKPVPAEKEAMVHLAGMAVLFALMIVLTFKDIGNLLR